MKAAISKARIETITETKGARDAAENLDDDSLSKLLVADSCRAPDASVAFCDVEQPRRFEPGELAARKPFRRNLEADLVTNQTGARVCGWKPTL